MKLGKFITFEGIDGSGKSTAALAAFDYLQSKGVDCILTREPGGTSLAEALRGLLLSTEHNMTADVEILILQAARAHHVIEKITPALEAGTWVICDRFADSTYAYQSKSLDHALKQKEWIDSLQYMLKPDVTFYMSVDYTVSSQRMAARNSAAGDDRIEQSLKERLLNMITVYSYFKDVCDHYVEIDANAGVLDVQAQIQIRLDSLLDTL